MNKLYPILLAVLFLGVANAYTTHIEAPAVLLGQDNGVLTSFTLNVTPGTGVVNITGPSSVAADTNLSADNAVIFATNYLGVNESKYNFEYSVTNSSSISGPSAGAALTVLAISALEHKQLYNNFTMTGTISLNGSVGQVGGVYDKVEAAARAGKKFVLVPWAAPGSFENEIYYISQQTFGIPLIEISNVTQALPYAYGNGHPYPLAFNITENYTTSTLQDANFTCQNCNLTAFGIMVNNTFNFTGRAISNISNDYAPIKQRLQNNLQQYKNLATKGYLYSAADLAFLDYVHYSYVLDNSANATSTNAQLLIDNMTSYCTNITPPPMTSTNYEYIISGEIRQGWALVNLQLVQEALNESESSDDVLDVITNVASSAGWCSAANQMYLTAAIMGGTPVSTTAILKTTASNYVYNNPNLGQGLYAQAAALEYKQGRYAAAIYDGIYSEELEGPSTNNTIVISNNTIYSNESNLNAGAWPLEFGNQALFFIAQADNANNHTVKTSYQQSAYSVLQLALGIDSADRQIVSSFVENMTAPGSNQGGSYNSTTTGQISSIQGQINQIYEIMLAILVLVFVILVVLLFHLVGKPPSSATPQQSASAPPAQVSTQTVTAPPKRTRAKKAVSQ